MTAHHGDRPWDEALSWAARIRDPDFDDWDAHGDWLSSDPAHPALYHTAALALEDGLAALDSRPATGLAPAGNDNVAAAPGSSRRFTWPLAGGLAIAASLVALVLLPRATSPREMLLQTAQGETREARLPDGSTLVLNGGSALRFRSSGARLATLERGEAYLRVVRDPAHPFTLVAGASTFRDVGTAFDVALDGDAVRLAVGEGAVAFDPDGQNVPVMAGRMIRVSADRAQIEDVAPGTVGAWRDGRLVYRDAALDRIAVDLSRSLGEDVRVEPAMRQRRFTGVILLGGDHQRIVDQLARPLGLSAVRQKTGWRIVGR
jgi:transmembrane sensor